jgi:hypothetical protein
MNIFAWMMPYLLGMVALFVLSRLSQKEAGRSRKAEELPGGGLEFAPDTVALTSTRLLIGLFGLLGVVGIVGNAFNGHGLWPGVFCASLALLLAKLLPGTILLTDQGLEQRYWLGAPKQMRWKDVHMVTLQQRQRSVTVIGRSGVKIQHVKQLPDRSRLLIELANRCPEAMPREGEKRRVAIPPPPPPEVAPPPVERPAEPSADRETTSPDG